MGSEAIPLNGWLRCVQKENKTKKTTGSLNASAVEPTLYSPPPAAQALTTSLSPDWIYTVKVPVTGVISLLLKLFS